MHPIEAVSILSQLAYVQPATSTQFADAYVSTFGHLSLPKFAQTPPYTPLYSKFTYISNLGNAPIKGVYRYDNNYNNYYNPSQVGKKSSYEHTLFLMTRDMTVLNVLHKVKPAAGFYCVLNEDPIESKLSEAEFIVEFNVNTVYPCTGPVHDKYVPNCVCPVTPPPVRLAALAERIKAHRAAAPFATRLRDLFAAVADAHQTAERLEQSRFPPGTLLANYTAETWSDLGIDLPSTARYRGYRIKDLKNLPLFHTLSKPTMGGMPSGIDSIPEGMPEGMPEMIEPTDALAEAARTAADTAEANLAAYIAEKEDAAFAAFKPEIRTILTTIRANTISGFTVPHYFLAVDDINPLVLGL